MSAILKSVELKQQSKTIETKFSENLSNNLRQSLNAFQPIDRNRNTEKNQVLICICLDDEYDDCDMVLRRKKNAAVENVSQLQV